MVNIIKITPENKIYIINLPGCLSRPSERKHKWIHDNLFDMESKNSLCNNIDIYYGGNMPNQLASVLIEDGLCHGDCYIYMHENNQYIDASIEGLMRIYRERDLTLIERDGQYKIVKKLRRKCSIV